MSWHMVFAERQPDERVFVVVYSQAVDLHWVIDGLPEVVAPGADSVALGSAILRGLCRSSLGRLHRRVPEDREFLSWVGAKTYAAYTKGVRSVEIFSDFVDAPDTVELTPQERDPTSGAFGPLLQHRVVVRNSDAASVGLAVLAAFNAATT